MTYDDLLHKIGDFGTYQKRIYFMLCLTGISCAFHKLGGVFILAKTDHRCKLPNEPDNASYALPPDIANMSYPFDYKKNSWSSCEMYDVNFTDTYYSSNTPANRTKNCDQWIYDKSKFKNTAIMEFNLVCDRAWYKATSDSMLMFGVMLGAIIFGYLSDRIGRKYIFTISAWLQLISGCSMAFAQGYWSFAFLRLLVGTTTSGLHLASYCIGLEFVSPSYRMVVGIILQMFFCFGFFLTSLFAFVFNEDWRYLQLAISLPTLCYTTYHWFIPESVRWLLTNGKQNSAIKILQKMCSVNNVDMSTKEIIDLLERDSAEKYHSGQNSDLSKASYKYTRIDILKYPVILTRAIILLFLWFTNSIVYYGLSWNTSNLGENQFLLFNLVGLVELPAFIYLLWIQNRWGRKINMSGFLIFSGFAFLTILFIPKSNTWLIIFFVMMAKLGASVSYTTLYVYTVEQYPTVIRNMALGLGSFISRLGGIIVPFIINLSDIWIDMPLLIYGILALLIGSWSLLLPESLNNKLPDSLEDFIAMSEKKQKLEIIEQQEINKNTSSDVK